MVPKRLATKRPPLDSSISKEDSVAARRTVPLGQQIGSVLQDGTKRIKRNVQGALWDGMIRWTK